MAQPSEADRPSPQQTGQEVSRRGFLRHALSAGAVIFSPLLLDACGGSASPAPGYIPPDRQTPGSNPNSSPAVRPSFSPSAQT